MSSGIQSEQQNNKQAVLLSWTAHIAEGNPETFADFLLLLLETGSQVAQAGLLLTTKQRENDLEVPIPLPPLPKC